MTLASLTRPSRSNFRTDATSVIRSHGLNAVTRSGRSLPTATSQRRTGSLVRARVRCATVPPLLSCRIVCRSSRPTASAWHGSLSPPSTLRPPHRRDGRDECIHGYCHRRGWRPARPTGARPGTVDHRPSGSGVTFATTPFSRPPKKFRKTGNILARGSPQSKGPRGPDPLAAPSAIVRRTKLEGRRYGHLSLITGAHARWPRVVGGLRGKADAGSPRDQTRYSDRLTRGEGLL